MHLHAGHHVLDAGCGPGTDTITIGKLVDLQGDYCGANDLFHGCLSMSGE
jgi:hypothetical protein